MRIERQLLAGLLALCAATAATAQPQALADFYTEVDDLRAEFEQVQVDTDGEVLQSAAGIFLLDRPDRFRWEYREPYSQIIVSDGSAFRFYDVDLAQVTVRAMDDTLRTTPAQLLAGGADLDEAFAMETLADKGDDLTWVRLVPRADDSDFREIRMGLHDGRPVSLELDDQLGQTTRIRFHDIRVNTGIDDGRFTLEVPEDVDVVDARGSGDPS